MSSASDPETYDIHERLRFLGVDSESRAVLTSFLPVLERELPKVLVAFYAHMRQWKSLEAMFQSEAAMERAGRAQMAHWLKLFSGRFDHDYLQSVRRIGLMHSRIGLDPRWYIGGYGFTVGHLYRLASSNFTSRLRPASAQARLAKLMRALNQCVMLDVELSISVYVEENKTSFARKLYTLSQGFETQVGQLVDEVAAGAEALTGTAQTLSATAGETSRQAAIVAAAAEQASMSGQTVASAAEELSASISEISWQVAQSTRMTDEAVATTGRTDTIVRALAIGAQKIGDVVRLISEVAAQTNLLALNATIEAARAGDAGKGFAVVASEVKNLASQTSKATDAISQQVSELQAATQEAVQAIGAITGSIGAINTAATAIAAAVEQQGAATQEIARSIQEAAAGTREVTTNISGVDCGARSTGAAAEAMLTTTSSQERQSAQLRSEIRAFVQKLRAA